MTRVLALLGVALFLSACAARGVISLLDEADGARHALQPVFVATNRNPAPDTVGLFQQRFGQSRDAHLRFARMDVSIPPVHAPGRIEWPRRARPEAARHMLVAHEERYSDGAGFLRALERSDPGGDDVVVFVHGYNVNNAEAVYRLAQIAHDFEAQSPVIAYSWPSAGSPRGYAYDRDSVIFSRDGLEALLMALTDGGRRVLVVAHSMGSQLTMETLRQMAISGHRRGLARLSGVALISPDIDEDVFVQQARRIQPFPQPFLILISARDRALNLAAFLTGKPSRLGSIDDPARLQSLPVEVIDLSDIEGGDRAGHATAFTAPAAIALLRNLPG